MKLLCMCYFVQLGFSAMKNICVHMMRLVLLSVYMMFPLSASAGEQSFFSAPEGETVADTTYKITIKENEGGSVAKNGTEFKKGDTLRYQAKAYDGYRFVHWLVDGEVVYEPENKLHIYGVTSDHVVEPVFELISTYKVTLKESEGGTVEKNHSTFNEGDTLRYVATPNEGFRFVHWLVDGEEYTKDVKLKIYGVNKAYVVEAVFELIPTYKVTLKESEGGTVEKNYSSFKEGDTLRYVATANRGYKFLYWLVDGEEYTKEAKLKIYGVTSAYVVEPVFEALVGYKVTLNVNNDDFGYVEKNHSTFYEGDTLIYKAHSNEGYCLLRWLVDGEEYSREKKLVIPKVTSALVIDAIFDTIPTYTITLKVTGDGTVTKNHSTFKHGDELRYESNPGEDKILERWIVNGKEVSSESVLVLTVTSNLTVEAVFAFKPHKIKTKVNEEGAGSILSSKNVLSCTQLDTAWIEAVPYKGYVFSHWEKDGEKYSEEKHLVFTKLKTSMELTAVFKDDPNFIPEVRINEVMPCNLSTVMDMDYYNFSGFLELKSLSSVSQKLKGCVITHYNLKKKGKYSFKWEWEVTENPKWTGSLTTFWCDEHSSKAGHVPYKLDPDGGYVLISKNGNLIDSLAYGPMTAHISFGRYGDGAGYMRPSLKQENTTAYEDLSDDSRCDEILFSEQGGIKSKSFKLTLKCSTKDAKIYYTTDGKDPDEETGKLYTDTIKISSNTAVRARAYRTDLLPGPISTSSYIYKDDKHASCNGYTLPIVALNCNKDYFYDDQIGIYIVGNNGIQGEKDCSGYGNYNRDWKRPVNFEYFVDGKQVVSQEVEASIVGGCSITRDVKSLALKTSKKTGTDRFAYAFFKTKPDVAHKTLHLRNGGTGYVEVPFRDGLNQAFAVNLNVDYQAYQPVAFYLNGKYKHMMALNERTNVDYLVSNYGVDEDKVDIISLSDQLGINVSKGDQTAYDELVNYLSENTPGDPGYFEGACKRMDMDEYIDYQIFEQFICNMDWPGNNTKIWRKRKDGEKFRWILFDTDFGFGLSEFWWLQTPDVDMYDWCRGKITNWGNEKSWMTVIFSNLSKDPAFKKKFYYRYEELLETTFSEDNIRTVFDSIIGLVKDEYCASESKSAKDEASKMRDFALQRPEIVKKQLATHFSDLVPVNKTRKDPALAYSLEEGVLKIDSEELLENVKLYAVNGSVLFDAEADDHHFERVVGDLPGGVYCLQISADDYCKTVKIVKK